MSRRLCGAGCGGLEALGPLCPGNGTRSHRVQSPWAGHGGSAHAGLRRFPAEAWQPGGSVRVSVRMCLTLGSLRAHHQVSHPPGGLVVEPAGLGRRGLAEVSEWISRRRSSGTQRLSEGTGLALQLIRTYPGSMRGTEAGSEAGSLDATVCQCDLCRSHGHSESLVFIATWGL